MKKILLILALPLCLFGCDNQKKYEEIMKDYAISFYDKYQKDQEGLTNPTISIEQLKNANEYVNDSYDLEKLKNCQEQSYVELIIDQTTEEIKEIKYFMQCN